MVQSQFALTWDSYKNNICSGFSALQQSGEFVDMTLAADGHFVKVHQVLMALASPYLKDLMASAPCQHPVLFLNNISYTTLSFLLEYIYTGEVHIPAKHLNSFVEAAKSLHIKGLETVVGHENVGASGVPSVSQTYPNTSASEEVDSSYSNSIKRFVTPTDTIGQLHLPVTARKILIKHEPANADTSIRTMIQPTNNAFMRDDTNTFSDMDDGVGQDDDDNEYTIATKNMNATETGKVTATIMPATANTNLQFTVSIRGSLQVILNRYMYNLNSTQSSGLKRWRCIDYRNKKCLAFLVTKGNVVVNRANLHSHSYHDQKILAKIEKNAVFSALDEAEVYKEKENNKDEEDATMDSEDYSTFDLSRETNDKC